jgi:hypothetical protein
MNANQEKILVGIATCSSIDASEFQVIVVSALNKAVQSGGAAPPHIVAVLEVIKFSLLQKITESPIQKAPPFTMPPGGRQ